MLLQLVTTFLVVLLGVSCQWQFPPSIYEPDTEPENLVQLRGEINKPELDIPASFFTYKSEDEDLLGGDDNDDEDVNKNPVDTILAKPKAYSLTGTKPKQPVVYSVHLLPSSLCGRKPLGRKEFCFKNEPYNYYLFGVCGPRIYKKATHFCYKGLTYNHFRKSICGKEVFDKLSQVCLKGEINNICGGEIFDPKTHFCFERIYDRALYSVCGEQVLKKRTHFCLRGEPYPKVKVLQKYGPKDLSGQSFINFFHGKTVKLIPKCLRNLLTRKSSKGSHTTAGQKKNKLPDTIESCGKSQYNTKTHFCYNNEITKRCSSAAFNPDTLICFRNYLYTKALYSPCGDNMYNKFSQRCYEGHVLKQPSHSRHLIDLPNFNSRTATIPQLEKMLLDYRSEMVEKERQDIYNISKQIAAKRRSYDANKKSVCGRYNKNSQFCYKGRLYNRENAGLCGQTIFNKRYQRCFAGHRLVPAVRANKPHYLMPHYD